ncbi:MAG: OmpA family protein [bacterium]
MPKKLFLLFTILIVCECYSEDDSLKVSYGLFTHFNLNQHSADFKKLPDCPSCSPGYETGSGTGFSFGALYEFPLQNNILFSGRLSYFDYSGTLNRIEETTVMYNKNSIEGEFEHNLDASLSSAGVEPGLKYNVFGDFFINLFLHAGFVVKSDYSQYEKITKPSDAGTFLYPDGSDSHLRVRNELSGSINKASALNLTLMPGISYELPLNREKTFALELEVFYSLGMMPIVSSDEVDKWNANSLRLGVAVKYSPIKKEIIIQNDTIRNIDTIFIESDIISSQTFQKGLEKTKFTQNEEVGFTQNLFEISRTDTIFKQKHQELICEIDAVGVKSDGTETPYPVMRVEEFVSSKLQPLLNYIFFEESSSSLQPKYIKLNFFKTKEFNENKLFQDSVLGVYYQLLNIIGSRMKKHPKAILRLVGCNDGYSSEKNDMDLSQRRAETVKEYFMNIWNIEPERLIIETRNLPDKPSTPIEQFEKVEENRRVELISDEYEIVKPVFMSDTIRITDIPVIRFKPKVKTGAGLKKWSVRVRQMDETLKLFENQGDVFNVDWFLEKEPKTMPKYNYPIIYKLFVEDKNSKSASTMEKFIEINSISISKKRIEKRKDVEYEKYSLILFDFNKADIFRTNSKIIDFIKSRLKNESIVNITGHTDRTGDDEYNLKLSAARALKTLESLGIKDATAKGYGEQNLLYNNDIPEGRFYCRTVNIEVETPVK